MEINKLPFRCVYCLMYQEKFDIVIRCEECKYNYYEKEEVEDILSKRFIKRGDLDE